MGSVLPPAQAGRLRSPDDSLNHAAYQTLRDAIVRLELPPNSVVDERKLAAQLSLGLAPVRHALRRLAFERLVVILPRRGTVVAAFNPDDLTRLFEMRLELEALAATLAAQRITPEQAQELEGLVAATRAAQHEADLVLGSPDSRAPGEPFVPDPDALATLNQRLIRLDERMHRLLAEAAHNEFLAETLDWLFVHIRRLWNAGLGRITSLDRSMEEHCQVAEAVLQGDAALAAAKMRHHIQHFQHDYLKA